jgi:poly-gamma-glutamate capsule biosynthesis protein CapA/YwtB (metallophosphatase superfamily)
MVYFHNLGLLKKVLTQHIKNDNSFTAVLPTYPIMQNALLLKHLKNGIEAFYKHNLQDALKYFSAIVVLEPSWSAAWAFLGKIQLKLKLFDDALISLEKSFAIFYNTEHPHFDAGLIYLEKKEYHKAEYEIKQAIRFATIQKNRHLIKLVIALREQNKIEEAFSYLDIIKQRDKSNFGYLFQSGRLHLCQKNYESARFYFKQALLKRANDGTTQKFFTQANEEYQKHASKKQYKLFASGDCMLARRIHYFYEAYPLEYIVNDIESITKECDIVMTNLEAVISNQGAIAAKGDKRPFVFRGSPELLNILLALNVNLVTTANNHAIDYGESALLQQKKILDTLNIASPGSGSTISEAMEPAYFELEDMTIAFISIFAFYDSDKYRATRNKAGVFHESEKKKILKELQKAYEKANKHADVIVLSPHWMQNWTNMPTNDEQLLAREIIDIGYDAIIGHSSHILHGMEVYKNKPIIYDMGTFLVDNIIGHKDLSNSASFVLTFSKNGFEKIEIYPLTLQNGRVFRTLDIKRLKEQKENYITLSHAIKKETIFTEFKEKLLLELHPTKEKQRKLPASKTYKAKQNNKSIEHLSLVKPSILLNELPNWAKENALLINFENKFTLLASQSVEVFRSGTSFLLQTLLKVDGFDSTDQWEVHIVAKHEEDKDSFEDLHPVSHGIYNPSKWQSGQLLLDQAAIRPKTTLIPGMYKLYFGFYNKTKKQHLTINGSSSEKFAEIGTIAVVRNGVPNCVSGIDWSGKY